MTEEQLRDFLGGHYACPRLDLWDWRRVLTAIAASEDHQLFRLLTRELCEDDASDGIPSSALAWMLYVPDAPDKAD